jgi:hypothetical protein
MLVVENFIPCIGKLSGCHPSDTRRHAPVATSAPSRAAGHDLVFHERFQIVAPALVDRKDLSSIFPNFC